MKKKIISIFFVLFAFFVVSGSTIASNNGFSYARKYEIETKGVSVERIYFNVRDGIVGRLDKCALKLKNMGFDDVNLTLRKDL